MGDVFYATNKQTKVTKPNRSDVFYATNKKQGTLKPSISSFTENVSSELKSGIANSKAIAKSKQFNAYVSGNPIPHVNPQGGVIGTKKEAEEYAKKATAGDGFEGLSLDELKKRLDSEKEVYERTKGNAVTNVLDFIGSDWFSKNGSFNKTEEYKNQYKALKNAYENRKAAYTDYTVSKKYGVGNAEEAIELLKKRQKETKSDTVKRNLDEEIKTIREDLYGKGSIVKANVKGLTDTGFKQFLSLQAKTMDATLGNVARAFGFKNNIFSQTNDYYRNLYEQSHREQERLAKGAGDKYNISGSLGEGVSAALPDAAASSVIAILTGGASVAPQLGKAATGIRAALQTSIKSMAKNPFYWSSFIQTYGSDFEDAKSSGANDAVASLYAVVNSSLNAAVEVGGGTGNAGIQSLPEALKNAVGNKNAVMEWVKSALDEGKEEVIQGVITQLNTGLFFDRSKAIYSNTDENAVFNPSRMLQEGAMGAAVGAVLGSGQMTISAISNAAVSSEWRAIGETVERSGIKADELAGFAAKSLDTETRALGINSMNSKSISAETIGKLYSYACRSISTDILLPENINEVSENFNKIMDGTDSKSIQDIASACFVTKLMQLGIDEESAEYMASGGITTAENTDLQSTAKAEDHSEVLHEPETKDIAEKYDFYDTVNAQLSEKPIKTSQHRHIEKVSNTVGLNVSWNEKVSRGKYIPSERRIVLNPNLKTSEMYNFVFKHEFTHSLETKKGYDGFKDYVFKNSSLFEQWARERLEKSGFDSKGSREEIIKRLTQAEFEAYKNSDELSKIMRDRFTMQNAEAEVLADFVGENLLGTGDRLDMTIAELERIKARNPGIIQRIRDFIRDMINRFKGNKKFGSLVNDLEYLNSRLEKVVKSKDKNTSDNQTEKYSIVALENGNTYVKASRNVISGDNISAWRKQITNFFNELLDGEKSLDISTIDGDVLTITKSETANKARDNFKQVNGQKVRMSADEFRVKLNAEAHIDEIAETSIGVKNKTADTKSHDFASNGFTYRTAYFQDFDGTYYRLRLSVGNNGTIATVYNVGKINKDSLPSHTKIVALVGSRPLGKLSDNSISNNDTSVNTNITDFDIKEKTDVRSPSSRVNAENGSNTSVSDITVPQKEQSVNTYSTREGEKNTADKQKQLEIINLNNPAPNEYSTWVRSEDDIKTFEETLHDPEWAEYDEYNPDFTKQMAERALKNGEIKVYSSYPIEQGVFVSPSRMEAESYSGNGKVYEKTVRLSDVAWIDPTQGQYANISENPQNDAEKYSIETESTNKTEDFDKIADLVNRYNNGEISKNEYYEQMRENWQKAGGKYGTIPEGEKAAEDYGVPNAAKDGAPTRRYVRTVLETGSLTDSMKDQIGAEILQGNFSYSPVSDENAIKSADKAIESGKAEKRWKAAIESKNISKKTIAIGERLLADAIKAKDNARVLELSTELSDVLTRAGQVVQSARLLKQMTGVGRLVALQRTVQTLNADLAKRFGDKAPVIQIDENVAQIMAESQTEEEIERAYQETVQDIADQVPATFLDKWNAWRYFAMLANPRTHIRNIVGNTIFIPAVRTKDVIATGIERMAQLGNSEVERTKVVTVKKEYREFAKNDANSKEVKALLKGQKYDERSQLYEMRRTFKNNALEFLTSFNGSLLEAEDLLFKNRHYIHALGSFLQARKADLNNVSESLLFEARSYAVKEAQKATFNDESAIANYLKSITQIKDKDTTALKVAKIAIDGVIPFKRTPVNIIRRGIEYSPIGLGKALTAGLYDVKKGKISISEFADGLAAGLTGTGIFAIGLLLSGLGYVNGGFGDDDEDKFKKLNGEQEYSVRVFGKSYTIDWAAPACIPFFIGVETANSFKDGDGVKLSDFTGALWNSLEPVTNLSMLSGIQNTISAAKYSSASETLASIGEDIALSYAMQGIPSLAGSISRTIDPTQRSWYTDKNSSISKFGQEAINNIESKIPGVSYFQAPSIDQWGRIKNRGKLAERLTENFLSPGYYSDIEYDDVNSELKRIIEKTGDTKVVPKKAPISFNVNKKQKFLTAKEYTTFAAAKGQMSFDYVKEFIETPAYKKLTDKQRIEVISGLYEYAGAKAKTTVSDYDLMKSYKTVTNLERNGTSAVYYYISRALK